MKIDHVVSSRIGALMPEGMNAAQAVVDLHDAILEDTSALTCAIVRHQREMPLVSGDLVVTMSRVRLYEGWKVLHRDEMGRLHGILRWESLAQEQH